MKSQFFGAISFSKNGFNNFESDDFTSNFEILLELKLFDLCIMYGKQTSRPTRSLEHRRCCERLRDFGVECCIRSEVKNQYEKVCTS